MSDIDNIFSELTALKERALEATLDAIGHAARRHRLDDVLFGVFTTCRRNGREVDTPAEITRLEERYCDEVHSSGFQALWTKKFGWGKHESKADATP